MKPVVEIIVVLVVLFVGGCSVVFLFNTETREYWPIQITGIGITAGVVYWAWKTTR